MGKGKTGTHADRETRSGGVTADYANRTDWRRMRFARQGAIGTGTAAYEGPADDRGRFIT
jgi:hypothetical protein